MFSQHDLVSKPHAHVCIKHENHRDFPIFSRMGKIVKCANNSDVMTLRAEDDGDVVNMVFESSNGERYVQRVYLSI